MSTVVIGMDPHKQSATIEVMDSDETVLGRGRYGTCPSGYRAMVRAVRHWPARVWAIEGCQGTGGPIARRLLADGEQVVDVPPKLPARTRVFTAGQGRKTDATDAHAIALAAVRSRGLHPAGGDVQLEVLRVLADRRRALGEDHTRMVSQLHQLLLDLIPGARKRICPRPRPRSCCLQSGRGILPGRPGAGWPPGSSPTWNASTSARRPPIRSWPRRWRRPGPR